MTNSAAQRPPLFLKPHEERRLKAGHLWVYSNEVDTARSPLTAIEAGQCVDIFSSRGQWLGWGFANSYSLISARIISHQRKQGFDLAFVFQRLQQALQLRRQFYAKPYYRLVFGESDLLPGLVVDRYGEHLVGQTTTAGMNLRQDLIAEALQELLQPKSLLWRNDVGVRQLENLPLETRQQIGTTPDETELQENGLCFRVPLLQGQKTGWFYDQYQNRTRLAFLVSNKHILDLCSYVGGWSIQALANGAETALAVDASPRALEFCQENARLNHLEKGLSTLQADVFDALRELRHTNRKFDLIIIDPPAFIKRKKDLKVGTLAYQRLNQAAMQILQPGGLLMTCSCSYHMDHSRFQGLVTAAGRHVDRDLQLLHYGGQAPDHPVHPAMPETRYLKALLLRCLLRG
ncbi:MAG TPA: class I SAM-dependent rRNA methyltransferase [Gammaproteobacteria bacterium]|nr:class I SAM-dependent rRNA methyltransferase [Gammaproteobacteria bacterium]